MNRDVGSVNAYGLYIHIPFCQQKCFYCDFPSVAGQQQYMGKYIVALKQEMQARRKLLLPCEVIDTVYIGGGTPTLLSTDLLLELVAAVKEYFPLIDQVEFTIEANPGTVDIVKLAALYKQGVNRISFGVQSFADTLLKELGRIHTAVEARQAITMAKACGFSNINLDLMYGLPKQTLPDLQNSVDSALEIDVAHIAIYGLQIEEGTVFAALHAKHALALPADSIEDLMYEYIMRRLPEAGYERYEISNFAKNDCYSKHNLKYWQNKPYIGVGAAAHSYYQNKRFANIIDVKKYIDNWQNGIDTIYVTEELDAIKSMEEFCFLALRTQSGIDIRLFEQNFQSNIFSIYGDIINRFVEQQLLKVSNDKIYLTERGMKYANQIFCEFLQE